MREKIFEYIKTKYKAKEEYPWYRYPNYAVFRHEDNQKWFALTMDIQREKLGLDGDEFVDIINLKLSDGLKRDILIQQEGIFRGYHISRGNWISVLLDGTVDFDEVCMLIDESFNVTASKKTKDKTRPPKEWIIPSNPKYYDVIGAFEAENEIVWKQGKGIKKGDTVFMYVAAPVSAILFKCKVTKTDIAYKGSNPNVHIPALMQIKLEKRYPYDKFTFDVLNEKYDIRAVRGPRGIPESLSRDL